ncbi:SDR family oxidoreductase [soil metagenome]
MSNDAQTVCLVTGANRGLGREIARRLAANGAFVYLAARHADEAAMAEAEFRREGFDVVGIAMDMTRAEQIAVAASRVASEKGRLDVLVNNAGVLIRSGQPPSKVPMQDIRDTLDTNLLGSIAVMQAFIPLLKASDAGRIVNVSSGLGSIAQCSDAMYEYAPYKTLAYSVSKAALNAATVLFAEELANTRIKVNAADPGHCATDLNGFTGKRTAAQGAAIAVRLATLPDDGPSGGFFDDRGRVPW